jgi:hypothetical protein
MRAKALRFTSRFSRSRAGYYRQLVESQADEAQMALRTAIQEIVLTHHRRYGYRRVTAELHRRGMVVNHHKRVLRLMRSDAGRRDSARFSALSGGKAGRRNRA